MPQREPCTRLRLRDLQPYATTRPSHAVVFAGFVSLRDNWILDEGRKRLAETTSGSDGGGRSAADDGLVLAPGRDGSERRRGG